MRALVTGATGFIGGKLAVALADVVAGVRERDGALATDESGRACHEGTHLRSGV